MLIFFSTARLLVKRLQGAAEHVLKVLGVSSVDYLINNAAVSDPEQSRLQYAACLVTWFHVTRVMPPYTGLVMLVQILLQQLLTKYTYICLTDYHPSLAANFLTIGI